jgi:hypothetical protein
MDQQYPAIKNKNSKNKGAVQIVVTAPFSS